VFEPAIRDGSAAGRERARAGQLARDAAAAAKGRRLPEQRRGKALRILAAIPPEVIAQANKERARRHLARVAAHVAGQQGYPDIGAFVLDQVTRGASLAAISRQAGLSKDWLSRHLPDIDPQAAAARQQRPGRWDARWQPALRQLGFPDVASYLHDRHIVQHRTVNAIAAETGLAHHAVESALRRHGLAKTVHAAKRHAASQRAARIAAGLGFDTVADYVGDRRAAGWTWRAMATESGQPESWLRRHQVDPAQAKEITRWPGSSSPPTRATCPGSRVNSPGPAGLHPVGRQDGGGTGRGGRADPVHDHHLRRRNPQRDSGRAIHGLVGDRSRGWHRGRPPDGRSPIPEPRRHRPAQRACLKPGPATPSAGSRGGAP
jgi:hypothetical protein